MIGAGQIELFKSSRSTKGNINLTLDRATIKSHNFVRVSGFGVFGRKQDLHTAQNGSQGSFTASEIETVPS